MLLAVNVLPSAIVNVALVVGAVIVTLLIDVADATPRVGVTRLGLLLNTNKPVPVSSLITPANCALVVEANWLKLPVVARVPDCGTVTLDPAAFAVNVKLPVLIVNVRPLLFTPVPPYVELIILPCQVPVLIVPTLVNDEPVTFEPNVVALNTLVDNLTGTAVLTPQTTWNYSVTASDVDSMGGRLRNAININVINQLI